MPIVGMTIKSVEAKRTEDYVGEFQVQSQTNLGTIKEQELGAIGKLGAVVPFEFKTIYLKGKESKEQFANIIISGEVYLVDSANDKPIEEWKKEKRFKDETNISIINSILRRCVARSIGLSDELQLPPPISFPYASKEKPKQEESRYIG